MTDFNAALQIMGAAIDEHLGEAATWAGAPVRVQHFEEDQVDNFGDSRALQRTNIFHVRRAVIPSPKADDVVVLAGGRMFKVVGQPAIDPEGFWECGAVEIITPPSP